MKTSCLNTNTIKSIQTSSINGLTAGKLALYIECRKCGYNRTYLIENNLKEVQKKTLSSLSVEVACEKCKNIIYVGLGYVPDKKGYSYKKPDFFGKGGLQVLDENGLSSCLNNNTLLKEGVDTTPFKVKKENNLNVCYNSENW